MSLNIRIQEAVAAIQPHLSRKPDIALILGSGLGELTALIEQDFAVDYEEIPHFRSAGAAGHAGKLVFGTLGGQQVVCMQGRLHSYEGHTPEEVVFPLRVMFELGAKSLIVTNAAGGINEEFYVGDIMLITDHINFTGANPLTLSKELGLAAFPDMSRAYTPALRDRALAAANSCGLRLKQGVYLGVRGPNFETPAEIRAFRIWGADAVGMSTVFEVLTAVSLGIEVLGLSLITNMAAGILDQPITGEEVLETSKVAAQSVKALLLELLGAWQDATDTQPV